MIYCTDLEKLLLVLCQESFNYPLILEYLWKKQYVIPVLKPGKNKSKAESYRPISLTSQIGKLMERIVLDEMSDFLKRNVLLFIIFVGTHWLTVYISLSENNFAAISTGNVVTISFQFISFRISVNLLSSNLL